MFLSCFDYDFSSRVAQARMSKARNFVKLKPDPDPTNNFDQVSRADPSWKKKHTVQ